MDANTAIARVLSEWEKAQAGLDDLGYLKACDELADHFENCACAKREELDE